MGIVVLSRLLSIASVRGVVAPLAPKGQEG